MKIPKDLKDIKLSQLEKIADIIYDTETEQRLKEIAILCDTTYEELIHSTDIEATTKLLNEMKWFYQINPDDVQNVFSFQYQGIKYNLITEMNQLVFGQWVDLNAYIPMYQDNHWTLTKYIMALCSSIEGQEHSYPSTADELNKRLTIIENLSLDIVYGYTSYFLKKKMRWNNIQDMIMFLELNSQKMNTISSIQNTNKNMDGVQWFGNLLGKMLLKFLQFLGWTYLHVYLPSVSLIAKIISKLK
jgi:hypothetical protein